MKSQNPINPVASPNEWRCFHCDEVFTDPEQAALHFGTSQSQSPACQVDVKSLRELEGLLTRYQEEDTHLHRAIHRLESEHQVALRRAEEEGYARGLKDASSCADSSAVHKTPWMDTETVRLAKVALEEGESYPMMHDWMEAAMKVCRAVIHPSAALPDLGQIEIVKLEKVSDWINQFPAPTSGATKMMILLAQVQEALKSKFADAARYRCLLENCLREDEDGELVLLFTTNRAFDQLSEAARTYWANRDIASYSGTFDDAEDDERYAAIMKEVKA